MGKRNNNQKGFSTIEGLLIIVIIILIGFTGYYVYRAQKNADTTYKAINSTNANASQSPSKSKPKPTSNKPAQQYLAISEWGVRAPYSGSLTLTYAISSDGKSAVFSSSELTAVSSACEGRGGAIVRWASTDTVSALPASTNGQTAELYFANAPSSSYAHVGNYYYSFRHDPAACGDLSSTSQLYSQTNNAVQALVPTLKDAQ